MLKQRVITAVIGFPILVAVVWFGEPWFTLFILIWGAIGAYEFYRLVVAAKVSPLTYFGIVWTVLFILSRNETILSFIGLNQGFDFPLLLTLAVILPLIWFLIRPRKEGAFASWAWTLAGILYAGWMLGYMVALRGTDGSNEFTGRNWTFLAFFTVFAFDTVAFFVGRAIGRHKLSPSISPGKTWEGTIGGTVAAVVVTALFILPTPLRVNLNLAQAIVLGLLISIFGQLGDLAESLLKRNVGAKDSGKLLPGHGGILDRADSVVFATVIVYYYMLWVIR